MTTLDLLDDFEIYLRYKGKRDATIASYIRDTKNFLEYLQRFEIDITQLEPLHLRTFAEFLADENSEKINSVRRSMIGVRQFFRFMCSVGKYSQSPFDYVHLPNREELMPESSLLNEVDRMIDLMTQSQPAELSELRNVAIVQLLGREGLKTSELILSDWAHFFYSEVQSTFSNPGLRPRVITLSAATGRTLHQLRLATHVDAGSQPIFTSNRGRSTSNAGTARLSRHGLKFVIYEIGEHLGIKHLNAETLRHAAIRHLVNLGWSGEAIMNHLGLRQLGIVKRHIVREAFAEHDF